MSQKLANSRQFNRKRARFTETSPLPQHSQVRQVTLQVGHSCIGHGRSHQLKLLKTMHSMQRRQPGIRNVRFVEPKSFQLGQMPEIRQAGVRDIRVVDTQESKLIVLPQKIQRPIRNVSFTQVEPPQLLKAPNCARPSSPTFVFPKSRLRRLRKSQRNAMP